MGISRLVRIGRWLPLLYKAKGVRAQRLKFTVRARWAAGENTWNRAWTCASWGTLMLVRARLSETCGQPDLASQGRKWEWASAALHVLGCGSCRSIVTERLEDER